MNITLSITLSITSLAVLTFLAAGCDDDASPIDKPTDELAAVAEALGGSSAVLTATSQSAIASGTRYDQHEAYSPVPGEHDDTTVQMTFTSTVTIDLEGQGQNSTWDGVTVEVLPGRHPQWTEITQGKFGYTTGTATGFPPTDPAPMSPLQAAARWKQQAMATPAALVKYALAHPGAVAIADDETFDGAKRHVITIDRPWGWPLPVRLFVDRDSHLPVKADTLEADPVRGDVLYEVTYADWRDAGTLRAPFRVIHSVNGSHLQDETRSEVTTTTMFEEVADFSVPAPFQVGYDETAATLGTISSTYFNRFQGFAFPVWFDQSVPLPPFIPGLQENVVVATSGAQIIQYKVSFYNTMVVEMPTYLVVVEAPLYETASAVTIAAIKARFPDKPVKAIASTHFHFDHTGGIRRYLAEWPDADLYVPGEVVDFYAEMVKAPHTVVPDKLARTTWRGTIRSVAPPAGAATVGTPTILSDTVVGTLRRSFLPERLGARTVKLFDMIVDHSKGTVVAVVDDAQVLFTTDLDNPTENGAGGPLPDGKEAPAHDLYARQLYSNLASIEGGGYTPSGSPEMKFVGGHGAVGSWAELCVFGFGFGPSGRPAEGTALDPAEVCP